jgi:hypothetical protein
VVGDLYASYPEANLLMIADWHEHDGWLTEAQPATWQDLSGLVESDESLALACTDETLVSLGFFPEQRNFYLRIYVLAAEDNQKLGSAPFRYGRFDLTTSESLATLLSEQVPELTGVELASHPAKAFFDDRDGYETVLLAGETIPPELLKELGILNEMDKPQ